MLSRRQLLTTAATAAAASLLPLRLRANDTDTQTDPNVTIRRASDRGHTAIGWLDSRHSFSFGRYRDPAHMGFGPLRVINDDTVAPGHGFPTHPHRDMEIISYVAAGGLAHQDSMGNGSVIRPGDIQMMRAGTGVTHSEFNHAKDAAVHFLQIWVIPDANGLTPGYQHIRRAASDHPNSFRHLISPNGVDGSLQIAQDFDMFGLNLAAGQHAHLALGRARAVWLQVVTGDLTIAGHHLSRGDGIALRSTTTIDASSLAGVDALMMAVAPETV